MTKNEMELLMATVMKRPQPYYSINRPPVDSIIAVHVGNDVAVYEVTAGGMLALLGATVRKAN